MAVVIEPHLDEHNDVQAKLVGIDQGMVGFDQARGFEFAHTLQGRCGGKPDFEGELGIGDTAALLQDAQDVEVNFV